MKLLIDAGNSRVKFSLADQGNLSTTAYLTLEQVNDFSWLSTQFSAVSSCLICAVQTNAIIDNLISWFESHDVAVQILKSEAKAFELINSYPKPEKLGVDRWLAMLGALTLCPDDEIIVVDAGTATTVDVVSAKASHLGGWILPGITMMINSVFNGTELVSGKENSITSLSFASDTSLAVNQAAFAATIGMIEMAYQELINNKADKNRIKVILTGGNSASLSVVMQREHQLIDNLVFLGMRRYC